jgi:hypothetical protein
VGCSSAARPSGKGAAARSSSRKRFGYGTPHVAPGYCALLRWRRLGPFERFWNATDGHWLGIFAWSKHGLSKHGLSKAALEGNNSRVHGISQRGYGYCNPDNLMQVLYFSCCR